MSLDWTNAEYLDGPGFVAWIKQEYNLVDEQGGFLTRRDNLARRFYRWSSETGHTTLWAADELLTEFGGHISEIPDHLWIERPSPDRRRVPYDPKFRVREVAKYRKSGLPIAHYAKKRGINPDTFRKWVRGQDSSGKKVEK